MAKMVIMSGLPASGKSTKAKEILEQGGRTVRLNKDLMRTMLHFDKFNFKNEKLTRLAVRTLAKTFLEQDISVVIDDTNLNPRTKQSWVDLALECNAKIQYEDMETDLKTCLQRDGDRLISVGDHVILNMALSSMKLQPPEMGWVLCDIDGTLAEISHRLEHVKKEPKDWKKFFEMMYADSPRAEVVEFVLEKKREGYGIIIITARPEDYREVTMDWLDETFHSFGEEERPFTTLLMRPSGNKQPDDQVKQDMLNRYFPDKSTIQLVIDDRPRVIRMWKENGLEVKDVGSGIDF